MFLIFPQKIGTLKEIASRDVNLKSILWGQIKFRRLKSLFSLPTQFSFFILTILPFFAYFIINKKNKKWLKVFLSIVIFTTLILSKSFGSILGLIFLLFVIYIFLPLDKKIKEILSVSLFFITFSIGGIISYLRGEELLELTPVKLRLIHWITALKEFLLSPIYGIGLGNFGPYSSFFINPTDPKSKYTHNFFLQILSETGIIGILILILIALCLLKKLKNIEKNYFNISIIASLAVIFAYNLIDIGIFFYSIGIITSIIIGLLINKTEKRIKLSLKSRIAIIILILLILPVFYSSHLSDKAKLTSYTNTKESFILAKKSLRLIPTNPVAKSVECSYFIEKKEKEKAKKCADELFKLDPISLSTYKIQIASALLNKNYFKVLSIIDYVEKNYSNSAYFINLRSKLKSKKNEIK